jgi:hypothetical protein
MKVTSSIDSHALDELPICVNYQKKTYYTQQKVNQKLESRKLRVDLLSNIKMLMQKLCL